MVYIIMTTKNPIFDEKRFIRHLNIFSSQK